MTDELYAALQALANDTTLHKIDHSCGKAFVAYDHGAAQYATCDLPAGHTGQHEQVTAIGYTKRD